MDRFEKFSITFGIIAVIFNAYTVIDGLLALPDIEEWHIYIRAINLAICLIALTGIINSVRS